MRGFHIGEIRWRKDGVGFQRIGLPQRMGHWKIWRDIRGERIAKRAESLKEARLVAKRWLAQEGTLL